MIQLIANPDKFDGKLVRVQGFLNLEFEGDCLYLHREDFDEMNEKNALWVDLEGNKIKDSKWVNKCYVLCEGIFKSKELGHMDMNSGTIGEIRRLEKSYSRVEIEKDLKGSMVGEGKP